MSLDLAWAAGLFVGEGSFHNDTIAYGAGKRKLRMVISMQDIVAIERYSAILDPIVAPAYKEGGRGYRHPGAHINRYLVNGKPVAAVRLVGAKAELAALALYPYLRGTAKGAQLEKSWDLAHLDVRRLVACAIL